MLHMLFVRASALNEIIIEHKFFLGDVKTHVFCCLICRVLASLWLNLFLFECVLELVNFLEALQVLV